MTNDTNGNASNTETKTNTSTSRWQLLSGLGGEDEAKLSAEARDAGIRKLVAEVERLAKDEFARGAKVPAGERTVFWDPLARICIILGIARSKLSNYSRELTGMRAHEITDRIKAADLPGRMRAYVSEMLAGELDGLRKQFDAAKMNQGWFRKQLLRHLVKAAYQDRRGACAAGWAATLGYPNPSRLRRAYLLAHGISVEELEERAIFDMVQKFYGELNAQPAASTKASPTPPAAAETPIRKSSPAETMREVYDAVLKGMEVEGAEKVVA